MLNRRQFLTDVSIAAASVLLPAGVMASGDGAVRPSKELFSSLIGQSFRAVDEQNVTLNFILRNIVQEHKAPGLEQFTLLFEETYRINDERSGGLFRITHPETGEILLRMEPSVHGPRAYTASFSFLA